MDEFIMQIQRVKPWSSVKHEMLNAQMHQTLTVHSLISLGVGSVVGAGIFVMTGQAAALYAGPALTLSFLISSFACFLAGLCYAELASAIPVAGSAYTYTYVIVGEFVAWIVGACLTLEYVIASAAVAVGWSIALQEFMSDQFNTGIPALFAASPLVVDDSGNLVVSGSMINLPAVLILSFLTTLTYFGVKESAWFNHATVGVKLSILITFVMYGFYFSFAHSDLFKANHTPFIPPNAGSFGRYGVSGIFRGAGAIFFAYVGFDCICSVAAECVNPTRDLPRGLFGTLVTCTVLYVLVTYYLTGLLKYTELNNGAPVIKALVSDNAPVIYRFLVEIGTIAGLTSVCLVGLISQPRLMYAMAKDGLLPARLAELHPRYKTPHRATLVSGITCATIAGIMPLDLLGELISFGTLLAFTMVCLSIIKKRRDHPDMVTAFKVPYYPYIPITGAVVCLIQMFSLPAATGRNCIIYMALCISFYWWYSRHNSVGQLPVFNSSAPPFVGEETSPRAPAPHVEVSPDPVLIAARHELVLPSQSPEATPQGDVASR